jgi:hypothetical protein
MLGDKEAPVCIFTCYVLYKTGGHMLGSVRDQDRCNGSGTSNVDDIS